MQPELIAQYHCDTGENPFWHPLDKKVYWLDIPSGRIFRYDPAAARHELCCQTEVTGGFTLQEDGSLLLFQARGAVRLWQAGQVKTLLAEIPGEQESRFNDVIADPRGRVFCGTMPTKTRDGTLYRLDLDGAISPILRGVRCSNGLGFSPDLKRVYYTDSGKRVIYIADYNPDDGAMQNMREFIKVPEDPKEGVPDGLTVDAEGFIWSARWCGACIVRYDPAGKEERRISFPCRKVSSLIFGGEDYTDIYATTACTGSDQEDRERGAGGFFHMNLGIRGRPEFYSRITLAFPPGGAKN